MKQTFKKLANHPVVLLAIPVFLLIGVLAALIFKIAHQISLEPTVRSVDTVVLGPKKEDGHHLKKNENAKTFTSAVHKAEFQFNAIAPHWKEVNASEPTRKLELRTSLNNKDWTGWFPIEASGPVRDNDPHPDRVFAETPLFVDGRYFQYRLTLKWDLAKEVSPQVYDLKINQIDSTESGIKKFIRNIGRIGAKKASAENADPGVVSRAGWGSPDPYGDKYKGKNLHWTPSYHPVSQVFIHHTVTPTYYSDPSAQIRAIWDFHTHTRGWGDIGYNFLVDQNGTVYQGRFGGDNVVGGHVTDYNRGSMGVALLGCYDPGSTCNQINGGGTSTPNANVMNGLTTLLSRKTSSYEINPSGWNTFCKWDGTGCLNIPVVTGHRDAYQTSCPGDLVYNRLQEIRDATAAKNANKWAYSAKQLSFGWEDLSAQSPKQVTLHFKNTGTATWSNSSNKLLLATTEPDSRNSAFKADDWPHGATIGTLDQASVAPGQTGSFTFDVKRPNMANDFYWENLRLVTENGNLFGGHFALRLYYFCTFGSAGNPRPDGFMIRNPASGAVYLIEGSQKRHIPTITAAYSHRLDLAEAIDSWDYELNNLPNGSSLKIDEGTLLKAPGSTTIYITDDASGQTYKRQITSPEVMNTFNLNGTPIHTVSQAALNAYQTGSAVTTASMVPDGLVVKSASQHQVYLVKDGEKKYIISPAAMEGNGYIQSHVRTVPQGKIDQLNDGPDLIKLRSGSLIKPSNSPNVYAVTGNGNKRLITSPNAFMAAGYNPAKIYNLPAGNINSYPDSSNIVCNQ